MSIDRAGFSEVQCFMCSKFVGILAGVFKFGFKPPIFCSVSCIHTQDRINQSLVVPLSDAVGPISDVATVDPVDV